VVVIVVVPRTYPSAEEVITATKIERKSETIRNTIIYFTNNFPLIKENDKGGRKVSFRILSRYPTRIEGLRQVLATKGRHFMGPERVQKLSPYQRATSWEDLRKLNPTFAVGRGQHEARAMAIKALKAFRQTYRAALDLWRTGERLVRFPPGTWWMTIFHKAPVVESG
jgi:hypothetical protein